MTAAAPLRAFILDDEPLARARVRALLRRERDIDVVGEAGDPVQAIPLIAEREPDILFLDVQMPRMSGFDVIETLAPAYPACVIFVTAHDEFALKAFDVHALDYLLKPVDRKRFRTALSRATQHLRGERPQQQYARRLEALTGSIRAAWPARPARFLARCGRVWSYVPVQDIDWIGSAENYVEIHVGRKTHTYRETLAQIEERLDPEHFVRVHRSVIVNLRRVTAFVSRPYGDYTVVLEDGTRLPMSRRYRDRITSLVGRL